MTVIVVAVSLVTMNLMTVMPVPVVTVSLVTIAMVALVVVVAEVQVATMTVSTLVMTRLVTAMVSAGRVDPTGDCSSRSDNNDNGKTQSTCCECDRGHRSISGLFAVVLLPSEFGRAMCPSNRRKRPAGPKNRAHGCRIQQTHASMS